MKRQVLEVLLPFISFMHVIDQKKGHNMLALMLDPKYKSMHLVTSYLEYEATTSLVVDYDEKILLPLLLEAYKGLMPSKICCIDDEFDSLVDSQDLFQQTSDTSANSYKDIVTRDLDGFTCYSIDAKSCKCVLTWWQIKRTKVPHCCIICSINLGNPSQSN